MPNAPIAEGEESESDGKDLRWGRRKKGAGRENTSEKQADGETGGNRAAGLEELVRRKLIDLVEENSECEVSISHREMSVACSERGKGTEGMRERKKAKKVGRERHGGGGKQRREENTGSRGGWKHEGKSP